MRRLAEDDVARMFGVDVEQLPPLEPRAADQLLFDPLTREERDLAIVRVLRTLGESSLAAAGPERSSRWEAGWSENLADLERNGFQPDLLEPRYFRHDLMRLNGDYVRPHSPRFEPTLFALARRAIFQRYLQGFDSIVELGCGTGANLLMLHQLLPGIQLVGCDWARSSSRILELMARETGANVRGLHLDMFKPEKSRELPISRRTAILTIHAFEQLGRDFGAILELLLDRGPGLCIQIEPLLELYDPERLLDYLAIAYHKRRNYLDGYVAALRELECRGRVEILELRRLGFGSLFHEGYGLVVWKPCR